MGTRRSTKGNYINEFATFKKAIVTCENEIPDNVKMYVSSIKPHMNPALLKYDTRSVMENQRTWQRKVTRPGVNRASDWLPRHPKAYSEPIPTLLRGDDFPPPLPTSTVLEP